MKAIIQRVQQASVSVDSNTIATINTGVVVLLGVGHDDTNETASKTAHKIANMRIFEDHDQKMNRSLLDVNGQVLAVSQFTLMANTKKGNRPSFIDAARPEVAEPVYTHFCEALQSLGLIVEKGVFGSHMQVSLINDGPVTITL